jgi:hypothetical protein
MRLSALFLICLSVFGAPNAAPSSTKLPQAPIRFEPNRGQMTTRAEEPVLWSARGLDYAFLFTSNASVLALKDRAVRMTLEGANANAAFHAEQSDPGTIQYFLPSFQGKVPGYRRLVRQGVYPGIDVAYYGVASYGKAEQLEYDFNIAPGANPSAIRIKFDGADKVRLADSGDLLLTLGPRDITQHAPVAYQTNARGERVAVASSYRIGSDGIVTLAMGTYDASRMLVIDPVITYAHYFEGSKTDVATAITHDSKGQIYVTGYTFSTDFYIQGDYYSIGNNGAQDAWVQKINPSATDGNFVPYTTYYGGSATDLAKAIAVDANGLIYITGTTTSTDLPTTASAYKTTNTGATDAFLAVFDTTQGTTKASLVYATYFGGTAIEDARAIAVSGGKVYIAGTTPSSDFPIVNSIYSASLAGTELFISEFDITQSGTASLVDSTYIDASADDYARSIAVDSAGIVYLAGVTYSPDIPTPGASYQTAYNADGDGFLLKVDLANARILYGTYLGGSGIDEVRRIIVETPTRVALAGYTLSTDFPTTQSAYQPLPQGSSDAFLAVIDLTKAGPSGLLYSTYFGGAQGEVAYGLAEDSAGRYYLGGYTFSQSASDKFPISVDALNQVSAGAGLDGFLAIIDRTKGINGLIYSSYITGNGSQIVYGVDVAPGGFVYAVGSATADIFPAGQATHETPAGSTDGFILGLRFPALAKLEAELSASTAADSPAAGSQPADSSAQSPPESAASQPAGLAPASPGGQ